MTGTSQGGGMGDAIKIAVREKSRRCRAIDVHSDSQIFHQGSKPPSTRLEGAQGPKIKHKYRHPGSSTDCTMHVIICSSKQKYPYQGQGHYPKNIFRQQVIKANKCIQLGHTLTTVPKSVGRLTWLFCTEALALWSLQPRYKFFQ